MPKIRSFNEIYLIVRKATYAIVGNNKVNWAHLIMDSMIKNRSGERQRYDPYGNLITIMHHHFDVPHDNETPIQHRYTTVFDAKVIKVMKIPTTAENIHVETHVHHLVQQDIPSSSLHQASIHPSSASREDQPISMLGRQQQLILSIVEEQKE